MSGTDRRDGRGGQNTNPLPRRPLRSVGPRTSADELSHREPRAPRRSRPTPVPPASAPSAPTAGTGVAAGHGGAHGAGTVVDDLAGAGAGARVGADRNAAADSHAADSHAADSSGVVAARSRTGPRTGSVTGRASGPRPGSAPGSGAGRPAEPPSGPAPGPVTGPVVLAGFGSVALVAPARPPARLPAFVLVALLAATAGAGFARIFSVTQLRVLVPAAAVLPVVLVAVLVRRGRPPPFAVSVLVWATGFVVWASATVAADAGGPVARLDLVRVGVVNGWARLLDVAVPAPGDPDLLLVPVLVTWLVAAAGAELVVRTRMRLLPAVPAVLGLLAATASAVAAPGSNLVPTAVLIGLAGLLALARASMAPAGTVGWRPADADFSGHPTAAPSTVPAATASVSAAVIPAGAMAAISAGGGGAPAVEAVPVGGGGGAAAAGITLGPERPRRARRVVRAALALAVVVAVGLAAGYRAPSILAAGAPVDPRQYRSTPVTRVTGLNPLSSLAGWTAHPDEALFTLRLSGQPAGPVPLRLAVLSDYDGATWTSAARYTRSGHVVTTDPTRPSATDGRAGPAPGSAGPVTQDLEVTGLTGVLLPALDRPVDIDGPAVGDDAAGSQGTGSRGTGSRGTGSGGTGSGGTGSGGTGSGGAAPGGAASGGRGSAVAGPSGTSSGGAGSGIGGAATDGAGTDGAARADEPTSGFAVDADDGLLLRTTPLAAGDRFTVVSDPPVTRDAAELAALTVGGAAVDPRYLAVPADLPPVARAMARVAAGQGISPFQQAALLQHYLAANFQFDPDVPPGHSLAHVEHFLTDTRRGTSEQFATTFVLAARTLGLPSRLVVGFAPTAATPGGSGPTGSAASAASATSAPSAASAARAGDQPLTVTGRHALAWAEVRFDGVGWLPFFPTPSAADARGAALAGSSQGESAAQAALVDAAVTGALTAPTTAVAPRDEPVRPAAPSFDVVGVLLPVGLAVGALAGCYLAVALTLPRLARRRRRRARRPRERVVGAWAHTVEVLATAGTPVPLSASPTEVSRLAADTIGEDGASALRGMAALATLALFGPDHHPAGPGPGPGPGSGPGTGTAGRSSGGGAGTRSWDETIGRRAADEAWRLVSTIELAAWRAMGHRRRITGRLAPRTVAAGLRHGLRTARAGRAAPAG